MSYGRLINMAKIYTKPELKVILDRLIEDYTILPEGSVYCTVCNTIYSEDTRYHRECYCDYDSPLLYESDYC